MQRTSCRTLALSLLSIGLCASQTSVAQTANGNVSGHIIDGTSSLVAGAVVTLKDRDTHVAIGVSSNAEGLYTFPSIRPGNYSMTVTRTGFRSTTVTDLTVGVQSSLSRDVVLQVGSADQTVMVTAEHADVMVAQTSSELGTEIAETQIHDLPVNGRNFTQLLTLTPGASPVMTSQAAGNGVYVDDQGVLGIPGSAFELPAMQGQITRENLYLLDGVVNTDFTNGVYVMPSIIDDLQELKVQSHEDKAEFGGVLGGVVNVVTKSGTNQFHGSGWEFVRNKQAWKADAGQWPANGAVIGGFAMNTTSSTLAANGGPQSYTTTLSAATAEAGLYPEDQREAKTAGNPHDERPRHAGVIPACAPPNRGNNSRSQLLWYSTGTLDRRRYQPVLPRAGSQEQCAVGS
jgi:hypothetical protein